MIDKGKYASHGSFATRMSQASRATWNKPKLAVIQPQPTAKPRVPQKPITDGFDIMAKTFSSKFRFQSDVDKKPVAQQFVQPFMYIEKVMKKQTVDQKLAGIKSYQPFITTVNPKRKGKKVAASKAQTMPGGFKNLYEFQQEKRVIANKLFRKLFEADVNNLKDMFLMWYGKNKKVSKQIQIKQQEFVEFIKEIIPHKISEKQLRHFYQLYCQGPKDKKDLQSLSIKALSFNYQKYRKSQIEVCNILSEKSLKERYMSLKTFLVDFDKSYGDLEQAMTSIKQYQQSLKRHFKAIYQSYVNPFQDQINDLSKQLEQPIVKYDKIKKQMLTTKIQELQNKNNEIYQRLTNDFTTFMQIYQAAILPHHDLFFFKRTVNKLLLPIVGEYPYVTRQLIQRQIGVQQGKREEYLGCLSDIVVQLDQDKKHLGQDCFTLEEVVQLVLMNGRKREAKYSQEFILECSKKFIKQIKKQFLLKYELHVQSFDEFPSQQQIGMDLLHTCFEMECTRVLLKNQAWTQLLNFIPSETQTSKFHQKTIQANTCLEFLKRYFNKLDEKMTHQRNKSKQISLLAENVSINQFDKFAEIIQGVVARMGDYVEDEDEQNADKVQPLKKKVGFADIVDLAISKDNFPQKFRQDQQAEQAEKDKQFMIKTLLKSIFEPAPQPQKVLIPQVTIRPSSSQLPQQFQQTDSLAKSYYQPQGMNTNSFDIRYYQKVKAKQGLRQPLEPQVIRMGSSLLLSHLPNVQEVKKTQDPLGISRMILNTIDKGIKQQKKTIKEKTYDQSIKQGVSNTYFRDKLKLENKPTIFDSQGKSKYSVLLPVGYYQSFVAAQNVPDNEKWYLRAHHVETLTQNPLSKKDNVIHSEYQSRLDKLPPKKRPDQYVIEQNVKRKEQLIEALQDRLASLKSDLQRASSVSRSSGAKVPPAVVNNYLTKLIQNKEDKQLQMASYQGVLYDLRRKERELVVAYRQGESYLIGDPEDKWWERKDRMFNNQLRKDRLLVSDGLKDGKHRQYVEKLKNNEIY